MMFFWVFLTQNRGEMNGNVILWRFLSSCTISPLILNFPPLFDFIYGRFFDPKITQNTPTLSNNQVCIKSVYSETSGNCEEKRFLMFSNVWPIFFWYAYLLFPSYVPNATSELIFPLKEVSQKMTKF